MQRIATCQLEWQKALRCAAVMTTADLAAGLAAPTFMSTTTLANVVASARCQHAVSYTASAHSAAPAAGCEIVPAAWAGWCPLAAPRGSQRCHPSAPCCSRPHTAEGPAVLSARVAARGVHGADNEAPLNLKQCDTRLAASVADSTHNSSSRATGGFAGFCESSRSFCVMGLHYSIRGEGPAGGLLVGLVVRAHSITCSPRCQQHVLQTRTKFPCHSPTVLL